MENVISIYISEYRISNNLKNTWFIKEYDNLHLSVQQSKTSIADLKRYDTQSAKLHKHNGIYICNTTNQNTSDGLHVAMANKFSRNVCWV